MAEVALAVASAVKYVAISVSVVALVGLAYAAWRKLWWAIPYYGSVHLGGLTYMILKNVNPIMGLGGSVATVAFAFPAIQAALEPLSQDPIDAAALVLSLKGTSQLMAGGLAMGVAYTASGQNILVGTLGAALGAWLGQKYLWNGLVNFYRGLKIIDVPECSLSVQAAKADALKSQPECQQLGWGDYCKAEEKWLRICPRVGAGIEPNKPNINKCSAAPSPECVNYGSYGFGPGGAPGLIDYYINTGAAVLAYPILYPGQTESGGPAWLWQCDPNTNSTAFTPLVGQPAWNYFANDDNSPVEYTGNPGIYICRSTYTLGAAANWLTPNNPERAGTSNVTSVMPPGIYVVQQGQVCGWWPPRTANVVFNQWNIQGPFPPKPAQFNYQKFVIGAAPTGGQNPRLDAAWGGRTVCAPAGDCGPLGESTPIVTSNSLQPLESDRPKWAIPKSDDQAYAKAANRKGALAPIELLPGGVTDPPRYGWSRVPAGLPDQPTAAGLPFPAK